MSNKCADPIYDPTTGEEICPDEPVTCPTTDPEAGYDNILEVQSQDLRDLAAERQFVTMAVLFNYNDTKDETKFGTVSLPEISVTYDALTKLFFNGVGKSFASNFLNRLWKGLTNFSLADKVLNQYEISTGFARFNIP